MSHTRREKTKNKTPRGGEEGEGETPLRVKVATTKEKTANQTPHGNVRSLLRTTGETDAEGLR